MGNRDGVAVRFPIFLGALFGNCTSHPWVALEPGATRCLLTSPGWADIAGDATLCPLLRTSPVANALPGPTFCASRQAQQLFDHAPSRLAADLVAGGAAPASHRLMRSSRSCGRALRHAKYRHRAPTRSLPRSGREAFATFSCGCCRVELRFIRGARSCITHANTPIRAPENAVIGSPTRPPD